MKPFEYAAPQSLKDATALLGERWGETEVLAGGTDLLTALKQEITAPKRVVSLKNIAELRGINVEKNSVTIGAMTTLAELAAHADVQKHFPAIVTAAGNIGSPQMLNMGTVGGDLCQRPRCWYFRNGHGLLAQTVQSQPVEDAPGARVNATAVITKRAALVRDGDNRYHAIFGTDGPALFVSASSLGPVLVALGATVMATGRKTRKIAAADFFRMPKSEAERETALKPNEILTSITIPIQGLKNATYEVRHRYGLDWPYVTATVAFAEKNGAASGARVVLGHVAATPWPAVAAAKSLNGAHPDEMVAVKCGEAAVQGAKPLSGNAYKIQLVKTAVKRAILATRAA